jgi:hypothetical protein
MIDTSRPAFPFHPYKYSDGDLNPGSDGMTLRQYAAIHLKVPNSGTDWLDDMIRQSLKNEFAAKAMQGMLADPTVRSIKDKASIYACSAYAMADAMLEARQK